MLFIICVIMLAVAMLSAAARFWKFLIVSEYLRI